MEHGVATGKELSAGIQRRMRARMRYRRMRDRKLAVDYLGKWFDIRYTHPLTQVVEWMRMQLVAYNPDNHTARFRLFTPNGEAPLTLITDDFWDQYRFGIVRDAA